jgi:hypothetical protein
MDSVSNEMAIDEIKPHASHTLLAENALLGSPLEGRAHRVFDFAEELDAFGHVDEYVGPAGLRSETPYFVGVLLVPTVLLD